MQHEVCRLHPQRAVRSPSVATDIQIISVSNVEAHRVLCTGSLLNSVPSDSAAWKFCFSQDLSANSFSTLRQRGPCTLTLTASEALRMERRLTEVVETPGNLTTRSTWLAQTMTAREHFFQAGLDDGLFSLIAPCRHVGASAPRTDVDAHTSRWYVGSNASQWTVCTNTPHTCVSCFSRRTVQGNGSRWSVGASKLDPLVVQHKCLMAVVVVSKR